MVSPELRSDPAKQPERVEGPTPAGGAYAIAYTHDDGSIEIVEFDSEGREIRRTYGMAKKEDEKGSKP